MNLLVAPERSYSNKSLIVAIANRLGLEVITHGDAPLWVWMADKKQLDRRFINWRLFDLNKRTLGLMHSRYMGCDIMVDPTTHEGPVVEKILGHNVHGKLRHGPFRANPNRVYQKLLTNRNGRNRTLSELRIFRCRTKLSVVHKHIPIADDGMPTEHRVPGYYEFPADLDSLATGREVDAILHFLNALGVEHGECDLIRHSDGNLYMIDATINTGVPEPQWLTGITQDAFVGYHARAFQSEYL